jgi:AraC-like DNA-binding protein
MVTAARYDIGGLGHRHLASPLTAPGPLWALLLSGAATLQTIEGRSELTTGDAVWLDARTGFSLVGDASTEVAVADLRLVVAPYAVPSPLVVRDFATKHAAVAELVRSCPLDGRCRATGFETGYGTLIGAAMSESWLEDKAAGEAANDPVVARVLDAVVAEPACGWTVESLAALVHLSRSALNARFQKALGRSPARMLRDVRMSEARQLLSSSGLSVETVAARCGYGSTAAFSRAFAAEHGVSPQSWRDTSRAQRA